MKDFIKLSGTSIVVVCLAIMTFVVACCMQAFAQAGDTEKISAVGAPSSLTKQDAYRLFVRNHIVSKSDTISVFVTRVIDGDTFVCVSCPTCDDSIRIRVLELDTFEKTLIPRLYRQARIWGISPFEALEAGKMATIEAKRLLEGKEVTLHRGERRDDNIDIYDRVLRYVILPNGFDYSKLMREKGFNAQK